MSRSLKLLKAFTDIDEKFLNENVQEKKEERIWIRFFKTSKLKYALAPVCMIFIVSSVYIATANKIGKNEKHVWKSNDYISSTSIEEDRRMSNGIEKNLDEVYININIVKEEDISVAGLDAKIEDANYYYIPYFEYMQELAIPDDFDNRENVRIIWRRSDITKEEFDIINNYEFNYFNTSNNRKISIAFSDKYQPLRSEFYSTDKDKISIINETEVIIYQYNTLYRAIFTYNNINYDIETKYISEAELFNLLASIIK